MFPVHLPFLPERCRSSRSSVATGGAGGQCQPGVQGGLPQSGQPAEKLLPHRRREVRVDRLHRAVLVAHGQRALAGDRKSVPSLVLVSRDLAEALQRDYPNEPQAQEYLEELRGLAA